MSTPRALRGCVAAVMILSSGQLARAEPGGLEPTAPAPVTDPLEPPPGADPLEPPPGGDEPGLALDSPDLAAPPAASGSAEPGAGGIVVGGTLDYRVFVPSDMTPGMYEIHVNELFVTTNIGDHIAILAEQLLLTSELGSQVGQDHGFVYATFSELPRLPTGMALRIGRMRLRYGIDAKLDAPANPLRTPEYRTLGVLSDRAFEVSGFYGRLDYVAAIAMGPDFVAVDVAGPDGAVVGSIVAPYSTARHPIYVRVGTDFTSRLPNIGLSGFYGDTYPVLAADGFQAGDAMLFGGVLDQHRVIRKARASVDVRWSWRKLKLAGEYTVGRDREAGPDPTVQAEYVRADYTIKPQRMAVQLQYDRFADGRPGTAAIGSAGASFTYNLTEASWLRIFAQANQRIFLGEDVAWLAGSQLLMAF